MKNQEELARKIFEALNNKGAELGNASVVIINKVLKKENLNVEQLIATTTELLEELQSCRQHLYSEAYGKAVRHYGGEGSKGASEIAHRAALGAVRITDAVISKATK